MSMTHSKLALLPLFFGLFASACSGQTFDVGGFNAADGGDAGAVTKDSDAGQGLIDPIATGNSWTYDVVIAGTYPACAAGSNNTGLVTQHNSALDGKDAFLITSFCPGIDSVWYSPDGDRVYAYDGKAWFTALDTPVADGHTWSTPLETFVWKKIGALTVPAGTYSDCFEADVQDQAAYYAVTFCRGVGPVKWHYRDTSQNGYDATLTAAVIKN